MCQSFRRPLVLIVGALALCLASCSSNNKGKIEGKWKSTTEIEKIPAGNAFAEFKADGTLTITAGTDVILTAKYKLGTGDFVSLSDVAAGGKPDKSGKVKITISGDSMKWIEDKNNFEFVRDTGGTPAPDSKK